MPTRPKPLRERKVVQWALAYLASAWVLLEAFGFVADRFGWPPILARGATILLPVGLILVVILAWYHGEKGRQRVGRLELVLITIVAAAGAILLRLYAPTPMVDAETSGVAARPFSGAPTRFLVLLPDGETLEATDPALAISRDGMRLVYAAGRGDSARLYLRELASFEARPIPGTEGARAPFFSPDGEWVGFFADRAVRKVSLPGGSPQTLVEGAWTARSLGILSGSWGPDDTLLLSYPGDQLGSSIWQLRAAGGTPTRLTRPPWHENHYLPQRLPGGDQILVSSRDESGATRILAVSTETGEATVLAEPGANAHYLVTGHLVFDLDGDLHAVAFDPEELVMMGSPVPVIEDVLRGDARALQLAVSEGGSLAYVPAGVEQIERSLVWVGQDGSVEPVPGSLTDAYTPRIAPDGQMIAFQRRPASRLWLMDPERGTQRPVMGIPDTVGAYWHLWTRDGTGLVFNADLQKAGWMNLYEARVGARSPPRPITPPTGHHQPQSWSPDGETLIYTEWADPRSGVDILAVPVPREWTAEADRTPRPYLSTPASEFHPALSPDGRWMAYVSDVSGRWEVYVSPYPGPGPAWQVSTDGGSEPAWSPDGGTLYFRSVGAHNVARQMLAARTRVATRDGESVMETDPPRVLFDGPYFQCSEWGRSYDLAPDGSRFLMVYDRRPDLAATQINVVVNWFAELSTL